MFVLTDTVGRESEPVAEDSPTLVVGVERQEAVEAVLLLATAASPAEHLLFLKPGKTNNVWYRILELHRRIIMSAEINGACHSPGVSCPQTQ